MKQTHINALRIMPVLAVTTLVLFTTLPPASATTVGPMQAATVTGTPVPAVVRIEPAQSMVTAGETLTVSVMIDNANDLVDFLWELVYNPTVVTVDAVRVSDFLGSTGRTVIPASPLIDNGAGRTVFAAISIGPAPGASGTGELAVIHLTAQDVGESPLDLLSVGVGNSITVQDGSVVVDPALTPVPTRTPTVTPTITPTPMPLSAFAIMRIDPPQSTVMAGETFTVSVMIDDATDLGAFQFTLLYAPAVVTVEDVTVGEFLGSPGRAVIPLGPRIDNQAGRTVFGACTLGLQPGPNGAGVLATVNFIAQGEGQSALDLQNVLVLDTGGNSQVASIEDGSVVVESTPTPTPDPNWTPTPTPEPVIAVSPGEAPGGDELTFTGSGFTPNGLIEDLSADPNQAHQSFGYFQADASGRFVRRHSWAGDSPEGTYTYLAFDFTKLSWATVEFEMIRYRVYLPVVFR
ncbi:MAG: cohesin domain-containing protein [Anaerolineae bacterium]